MMKTQEMNVKQTAIRTMKIGDIDYICITDIAKQKNRLEPNAVVGNWMRNRNTIEYLGLWEYLNNPSFNPIEFEGFKHQGISQHERLLKLNKIAIQQMTILEDVGNRKLLK